jgi:PAS domain S-box-containing protein
MASEDDRPEDAARLRRRAEERARVRAVSGSENIEALSAAETRRTLHELRVHQIELEMQNEELRRTHVELEESRARYVDLYDFAPVGYCTVSEQGLILETNLTFAGLLGEARGVLIKQPFTHFVLPEDQDIHYRHFKRVLETGAPQAWELRLLRKDTGPFWARVEMTTAEDAGGTPVILVVVSDISEGKRSELRVLTGRLFLAQEEERRRISRELHDDLGQKLALLAIDVSSLLLAPPSRLDEMKEPLGRLQARIAELSQCIRQMAHKLHPAVLEDLGLTAALSELCEEFSAREKIEVVFEQEAVPNALPIDIASCLYRIAQEALHNVSKHARATQVRLKARGSPEGIRLSICDTGVGFDPAAAASRHGLGIVSMKERVALVQGEFSVRSQPGRGTEVGVFVPLPRETR